jgi:histidine ammonia-lyase
MPEPIVLRCPEDLTLEILERIAWEEYPVQLHPDVLQRVANSRAAMLAALDDGRPVYGVTTGMGYLAGMPLTEQEQRAHQANLLLGRAVGGPAYLGRYEARALLAARLASFLDGSAGVSPGLCIFIADRLNDGFIPAIPRTAIGCAGEIIPLAHAFQTFLGIGSVLTDGDEVRDAAEALAERGITPYAPGPKEGIALLAGAPGAVALAAATLRGARRLLRQLHITWACAIDALRAPLNAYDPGMADLANDPIMAAVLAHLGDLLKGSNPDRQGIQAPVSFRVVPQTLAHVTRIAERFEQDIRRQLAAVGDSPAFIGGRFISTGGFHAIDLATGLDVLAVGLIQAAELSGQHIHRLLDRRFSGLPDQLTPSPGSQAGLIVVHKRVIGTLNELRRLAAPASVGLADTSMGQEDAMSFAFEAAGKLRRVESLVREVLAVELLVCRQAWALRGSPPAAGLGKYATALAVAVQPIEADRPLGGDISILVQMLETGELL